MDERKKPLHSDGCCNNTVVERCKGCPFSEEVRTAEAIRILVERQFSEPFGDGITCTIPLGGY